MFIDFLKILVKVYKLNEKKVIIKKEGFFNKFSILKNSFTENKMNFYFAIGVTPVGANKHVSHDCYLKQKYFV